MGGNWATGSDWNTGVVPGPGDNVAIDAPGSYTVTISSDQTVLSLGVTGSATVAITNGSSLAVTDGAGASVSAGAALSAGAGGSLDLSSPLSIAGKLTNAGTISGDAGTVVAFASSTDRLILDPGATFTGAVVAVVPTLR